MTFGKDNLVMRDYIYSLIDFKRVNSILDIGCKDGIDLIAMKKLATNEVKLCGIDISERFINKAIENSKGIDNISFFVNDASKEISFNDSTFDLVYSLNLLECIPNKGLFLNEVHRVLKDDGTVVFGHFDWDSVVINGKNKPLIRKIISAFADNEQEWMGSVDAWMGRRLLGEFNKTGNFQGSVYSYTIINSEFKKENYGFGMINDFSSLVKDKLISQSEYDEFYNEMIDLTNTREYFFSINMYIYVGKKIKSDH